MTTLLDVTRVNVPRRVVERVQVHLRERGALGVEGVALWAGTRNGSVFDVREGVIPAQTAYRTDTGLLYWVDSDELHRVNLWLHEHALTLVAQVHSHPGAAYHSDTDDAYPIVTKLGSLSVVVPDFARRAFRLADIAVYVSCRSVAGCRCLAQPCAA